MNLQKTGSSDGLGQASHLEVRHEKDDPGQRIRGRREGLGSRFLSLPGFAFLVIFGNFWPYLGAFWG